MSPLSVRLVKAALACLALGLLLGLSFAFDRGLGVLHRPAHVELNLFGFVTLLIYGFGYHELPRFAGRALSLPRLAEAQSWLAIAGVALGALGWLAVGHSGSRLMVLALGGAVLQALAALLFAVNAVPMTLSRLSHRRA